MYEPAPSSNVAAPSRVHTRRVVDRYRDYAELATHETEGVDYRRLRRIPQRTTAAHIAIHGGMFEPPTSQLADHAAATGECAYYAFEAIKPGGNEDMHITSVRFDEPQGAELAASVERIVAWHGTIEPGIRTFVGGRDTLVAHRIAHELRSAGFSVATHVPRHLAGMNPRNITNRNRRGRGVQLEITEGQRRRFFAGANLERRAIENPTNRTKEFYAYTAAVNRALHTV